MPQFRALGEIERQPGCSLSDVAEAMGLALPAASKCVDALVQRKLVKRATHATDRRRVILAVTEQGQAVRQAVFDQARGYLARHLAKLSAEERGRIIEAMAILDRVAAQATVERVEGFTEKAGGQV